MSKVTDVEVSTLSECFLFLFYFIYLFIFYHLGLLSLVLHPDYSLDETGKVYAYYVTTDDSTEYAYVSQFQATDDVVDVTSEVVLMRIGQPGVRGNGGQVGSFFYFCIFAIKLPVLV